MKTLAKILTFAFLLSVIACANSPKQGDHKKEAEDGFKELDRH